MQKCPICSFPCRSFLRSPLGGPVALTRPRPSGTFTLSESSRNRLAPSQPLQKFSSASFVLSFVPPPIGAGRVWKDQEPASINAYLRQKRQVAQAEAARDVLTE